MTRGPLDWLEPVTGGSVCHVVQKSSEPLGELGGSAPIGM